LGMRKPSPIGKCIYRYAGALECIAGFPWRRRKFWSWIILYSSHTLSEATSATGRGVRRPESAHGTAHCTQDVLTSNNPTLKRPRHLRRRGTGAWLSSHRDRRSTRRLRTRRESLNAQPPCLSGADRGKELLADFPCFWQSSGPKRKVGRAPCRACCLRQSIQPGSVHTPQEPFCRALLVLDNGRVGAFITRA